MTFSEALTLLKAGECVGRRDRLFEVMLTEGGVLHRYDVKTGMWHYWMLTQTDVMANDWERVTESMAKSLRSRRGLVSRYKRERVI